MTGVVPQCHSLLRPVSVSVLVFAMSPRTNSATSRLRQDYRRLKSDPIPYIVAEPLPSNLLEWHYVVSGPEKSPFAGGFYHGKLVFPAEFPFKPPSIYMSTPSGRFKVRQRKRENAQREQKSKSYDSYLNY